MMKNQFLCFQLGFFEQDQNNQNFKRKLSKREKKEQKKKEKREKLRVSGILTKLNFEISLVKGKNSIQMLLVCRTCAAK